MAPFAFCMNRECRRVFDFSESYEETDSRASSLPPQSCPTCDGKVVAWCPRCMQSIANKPEGAEPKCVHCGAELLGLAKAKPSKAASGTTSGAAKVASIVVFCFELTDRWLADVLQNVMQ
jgi:hypothetical protein